VNTRSQQVWLALGVVALFLLVASAFGIAIAGALVAAGVLFLGVVNVLQGRSADDGRASLIVAHGVHRSGTLKYAIVLVWITTLLIVVWVSSSHFLKHEFNVILIDEYGLPLEDAVVIARFGSTVQKVKVNNGRGTIYYYTLSTPESVTITISYRGMHKLVRHTHADDLKFRDIIVRLFSGKEIVSVRHLSVNGLGIDAFLQGDLPPDLRSIYPDVMVLRNHVFEAANNFISIYPEFDYSGLKYERSKDDEIYLRNRYSVEVGLGGNGDPSLRAYFERNRRLRAPGTLYVELGQDMSSDINGYPTSAPPTPGL
jgi:hypothetical protein